MISTTSIPLTAADLEQRLLAVEPGIVLVSPRILRRVLKRHGGAGGAGLQVPHRKSYILRRDDLLALADRAELGLAPDRQLPEMVVLLPRPSDDQLAGCFHEDILRKYWRLLFHTRVHATLEQRRRAGQLSEAVVRARIRRLGLTEFAEAKTVLKQENFLLPPGDEATTYEEFAALYLELRFFAPDKLSRYFPSMDRATAESVLAQDLDGDALLAATRLDGVSDPVERPDDAALDEPPLNGRSPEHKEPPPALLAQADQAEAKGNLFRAAVLRTRAGAPLACEQTIERSLDYLRKALALPTEELAGWHRGLKALLDAAAKEGGWSVEARLLFDLQSICLDRERPVYAADLVEWIVSWGRKPIKRLLPYQGDVAAVKHLRGALRRLDATRLDESTRAAMEHCLHHALNRAEEHLRARLRPVIVRTLDEANMTPVTAAEVVARDKIVEELIDLVVEHGYLNLSDLRDAIARNRLKMPDLRGPTEFFRGDRLIRANRRFAESLDGVYHRGEIYLRWLQRLNSVAFGTVLGRFLTRYFILPFGVAFVVLEGFQHLLHIVLRWSGVITYNDRHIPTLGGAIGLSAVPLHGPRLDYVTPYTIGLVGVFILGLLYVPPFRRAILNGLRYVYYGCRGLLFQLPQLVFQVPYFQAFLKSRVWSLFYHVVVKPLLYSLIVTAVFSLGLVLAAFLWVMILTVVPLAYRALPHTFPLFTFVLFNFVPYLAAGSFLLIAVLVNLPGGDRLEEIAADRVVQGWHLVSVDLFPGLFRFIVYVSRRFLEGVERIIYTVDEWLRFRQGDNPLSFYFKVTLGLVWFCITYVVRFSVNLLIEPQINPIKHFPVVTVSHKLVLTMVVPPLAQALSAALGIDFAAALTVSTVIGFCIPGIFGFLVWELKENWKMYAANQSPTLDPNAVGSHGETVLRLLRPGFHSGTLPKLYAKLRRARGRAVHKQTDALHHVAESVRHFVERTLLATLVQSGRWGLGASARVAAVCCGCNRIRVELACPALEGETLLLDLEQHDGWLLGGIARRGWLAALTTEQAEAFAAALEGFYKLVGLDVVRERLAALLPPEASFTITEAGLMVWIGDAEVRYHLDDREVFHPVVLRGTLPNVPPALPRKEVVFSETELSWRDWVETWEQDRLGKATAVWANEPLVLEHR